MASQNDKTYISCGIDSIESLIITYEDNSTHIYSNTNMLHKERITKHIAPKMFYPCNREIEILQTKLRDNLVYLFTKSLPTSAFQNTFT